MLDQLVPLDLYFRKQLKNGHLMNPLYERVQYTSNIVPRLYLMITVGSSLIKCPNEMSPKVLLKDLLDACKGVQHPTRGLFLRGYLIQMLKDKLPDKENGLLVSGTTLDDPIDFILSNFKEMGNLWDRLKMKAGVSLDQREKERLELSVIVGNNLVKLGRLEGVDINLYGEKILPRILDIILGSKEGQSQQYLMECIIQAFPDEFHLATLELLCSSCLKLQAQANVRIIFTALMKRLATFVKESPDSFKSVDVVQILAKYTSQILNVYYHNIFSLPPLFSLSLSL